MKESRSQVLKRAGNVRLRPDMTVADAFAATLGDCIRHIHSNVEGSVRGKDPERLHQLRVGVRRLRAALSAYRDAIATEDRRAVGRALR